MRIGPFEISFRPKRREQKAQDFWTAEDVTFHGGLPRSVYAYGRDLRRGLDSNVIMSPVSWIMRTFTEAEPVVESKREDRWKRVDGHPLELLLAQPNQFYDGDALGKALVISHCLDGNAYLVKRRNPIGEVLELWYVPHWMIEPKSPDDGRTFISHYEYRPGGGRIISLLPRDVVHFRFGLDPREPRKGFSPLRPLLREIFTDEEASNFAAAALRNQGFPGVVISPKEGGSRTLEEAKDLKAKWMEKFTGDRRGEPFVATKPTDISTFGFNAQQLNLTGLRDISEERVCAMLGLPAAVVGFGAGLQQTKVGAPQPLSARLWTPDGPTSMGDVEEGDTVAAPGGWRTVRATYPQGEQDIYRVTFQDGSTAESTIDHLWEVHTPNEGWRTVPLSVIASWPTWKLRRAYLPLQGVTEFSSQPCLIPPYVMGLLLADGSFRANLFFSNSDAEIVAAMKQEVGAAYAVVPHATGGHDYRLSYKAASEGRGIGGGTGGLNPFKDELRRLGLWMLYSHEKFIPDLYRYNSSRVRLELLRGLLDGDGFVNQHGQPALEQTSSRLADDVTEIVQSLGGYTLRSEKKADRGVRRIFGRPMQSRHDRIHLSIIIDDGGRLFRCNAKRERCRPRTKAATRKFRSIEFDRREQAKCISLDGALYLTDSFLVTHNTMRELVRLARVNVINPMGRSFGKTLSSQLLTDFVVQRRRFRVRFDMTEVSVFQEDETEREQRIIARVDGGVMQVSDAQEELGLEVDESQAVYLRDSSKVAVKANQDPTTPAPAMPPPENRLNGDGGEAEEEEVGGRLAGLEE